MHKQFLFIVAVMIMISSFGVAQQKDADSSSALTHFEGQNLEVVFQLVKKYEYNDPHKALELARNGAFMAGELKNYKLQANFLIEEAFCLKRINVFDQALARLFDANELAEAIQDHDLLGLILISISDVYYDYELYDKALFYDFKALESCDQDEQSYIKARILENIGRDYNQQENYSLAINYLDQAMRIRQSMNDTTNVGRTYFVQAQVYRNLNNRDQAIDNLRKALDVVQVNLDQYLEVEIVLEMVDFFLDNERMDSTRFYLDQTLELAVELDQMVLLKRAYYEKYRYYQVKEITDSALLCHVQYLKYKDAVFSRGRDDRISEMEVKYQTELQEKKNAELEQQISDEKARRNYLVILIIVAVILGALLALYVRYRGKVKMSNKLIDLNKELEHRVEERTEELKISKVKAEESAQLKSAFLANLSHEIRTPMNAILGFSPFLNDASLPEEERTEYVKMIKTNGEKLMKIINDIIDLSKLTTHQLSVDIDQFTADILIDESRAYFDAECYNQEKDLEFRICRSENLESVNLATDMYRLRQITNHLVNNAIKFTKEGWVEVGCSCSDQFVEFYVKDSGIGISPEKQKIIFETFRQADNSHTRVHGGTGVGLTLVQKLVELLGGKLHLVSQLNKGTTVTIKIPREFSGDKALIRKEEALLA